MASKQAYPNPSAVDTSALAKAAFIFNQAVPTASWVIKHNLGHNPAVTVVDSTGRVTIGDIVHDSVIQCTITFSGSFSGIATCI